MMNSEEKPLIQPLDDAMDEMPDDRELDRDSFDSDPVREIDFDRDPLDEDLEVLASEIEEETADLEDISGESPFQTLAEMKGALECLLFTTSHSLSLQRLRNLLGNVDIKTLRGSIAQLQAEYDARGSGLQIVENSEGYQMCTRQQYAEVILKMHKQRKRNPLTMSALETLAIVAYKQPLTRAEIEMIRGVESSGVLRNLLDLGLIRVVGRKEVIGRPQLFGTTKTFLNTFGLRTIHDLPTVQDLRRRFSSASPAMGALEPDGDMPSSESDDADVFSHRESESEESAELSPAAEFMQGLVDANREENDSADPVDSDPPDDSVQS